MSVEQPEKFNERFTLYLNTGGKPVQRTLRGERGARRT